MAIGTLTVGVAANASKGIASLKGFRAQVKGTKDECNLASKSVAGMGSILTRFGVQLGGAVAAYATARTFKSIAQDLDTLAKKSDRLNIAPTMLTGLRHAAVQTGVAAATLDTSLGKMTLRIAEAAKGGGAAVKTLEEMNLKAAELHKLSPDQQFLKIAQAMGQQTNAADKLRLATTLFEEEGASLVTTLNLGAGGIGRMIAESKKLTGNFSRAELSKIESFNDELDKLQKITGGFAQGLVIDIAPAASEAIAALREAMEYWRRWRERNNSGEPETSGQKRNRALTLGLFTDEQVKNDPMTNWWRKAFQWDYAGGLTEGEQRKQQQRESRARRLDSMGPDELEQRRRLRAAAQGNAMRAAADARRYGQAFNDRTVGAASRAIGSGFAWFTGQVGSLKSQADAMRRTALGRSAAGLNPLTGLAPIQMSDARREFLAGRGSQPGQSMGIAVPQSINRLIEADSAEGYQALRANKRGGDDTGKQIVKVTEDTNQKIDKLCTLTNDWLNMVRNVRTVTAWG